MPLGVPALIALASVTGAGALLAFAAHSFVLFPGLRMSSAQRHLQTCALMVGLCATYFWVWALLNTLRSHFDAGVVSFVFPLMASASVLIYQPESNMQVGILKRQRWVFALSAAVPAANYVLGMVIALHADAPVVTLVCYMAAGIAWWLSFGIAGACLAHRQLIWLIEGSREHDHLEYSAE